MKKTTKLFCLLLTLILTVSLFSGCVISSEAPEEEPILEMTVAIPCTAQDPEFAQWQPILQYWVQDLAEVYNFNLTVVSVPKDEEGRADFVDDVRKGDVALFFGEYGPYIDAMLEEEALIDVASIRGQYATFKTENGKALWDISAAADQLNYMIPVYGTYQGLFINSEIFEANQIEEPKDWASFLTAIEKLKAAGITPIAAGFADQGLEYIVDDMILSEGGTAEHSYQPSFGVVSSWERATKDIKDLENLGAFTTDCYNVSYATAKQDFLNGNAAMIFAPSSDVITNSNREQIKAVPLPATPTGKREAGAFIGEAKIGGFISAKYFNQTEERYSKMVIEMFSSYYVGDGAAVDLLVKEDGFSAYKSYYFQIDSSVLGKSFDTMLDKATAASRPMRVGAYSMDTTVAGFRKALTTGDIDGALLEATKAEVAAREKAEAGAEK